LYRKVLRQSGHRNWSGIAYTLLKVSTFGHALLSMFYDVPNIVFWWRVEGRALVGSLEQV
jgi:hypothetical protein